MKRQVRLTVCLLGTLLTGLDVGMWANVMVPFLEAAPTADAVVLARYLDSDASHLRFGIIETYRGKVSIGLVTVPNGLWSYVSQQFPDDGLKSARFLLLLNADGSLRCGHFGTLIVLCGTC